MGWGVDKASGDSLLASYLINADRRNHGLKDLAADVLRIQMTQITDLIGKGKTQMTFDKVELEAATQYAAADADVTLQLTQYFEPKLDEFNARNLLETIELS